MNRPTQRIAHDTGSPVRARGALWLIAISVVALLLVGGPSGPAAEAQLSAENSAREDKRAISEPGRAGVANHGGKARNSTFAVDGDVLVGDPGGRERTLWDRFVDLIPGEERGHLRRFTVFRGRFADAFVTPLRRDPELWKLGVFRRLEPRFVDMTLIHEFAHLMTLKAEQVPPSRGGKRRCETYYPGEGCALPDSYLAGYVREFWQDTGRLDEWKRAKRQGRRGVRSFYRRYRDEFVSNYAPTHPAEDIAESFTIFVIDGSSDRGAVADAKVRFFERFPELLELRERIRAADPSR